MKKQQENGIMCTVKTSLKLLLPLLAVCSCAYAAVPAGDVNARYATDAYPGFDTEKDEISPSRKEPRWFSWITGPKKDNASEQMTYCTELEADENWSKAIKHYDALVRNWPTAPEAPYAQKRMAELLLEKEDNAEEAFAEYRYLVDFYSFSCDYNATVDKMYEIAGLMREQGKRLIFFHFKNTVDVRRAYEAVVLRAPGAKWTPQALLTIGDLREEEGKFAQAVEVYENLRNLHYGSDEAREGVAREAAVRMELLNDHGYNRARAKDTKEFLELAMTLVVPEKIEVIEGYLAETTALLEEEAYRAACFYDTKMRTTRNAVNAYELFLKEYPNGVHAEEVRARLEEMKGASAQ